MTSQPGCKFCAGDEVLRYLFLKNLLYVMSGEYLKSIQVIINIQKRLSK